jgi:tRNA1Val (adenine37-N6)-methyltransferase
MPGSCSGRPPLACDSRLIWRTTTDSPEESTDLTRDRLLDGRVRLLQPRDGFRSGIEPVMLAAAVPARAGDRVLEGGSGSGAGLLCLAARVPGVQGVGVEADARLAALATRNAALNHRPGLRFVTGDIGQAPAFGPFDHAFANPPYHAPEGTRSTLAARETAKRGGAGALPLWVAGLAGGLRHRGTLTLILPAGLLAEALATLLAARCRPRLVLPLWPRAGRPAKLVLLRGVRDGRSPVRLLPGLVLHEATGMSAAAEAVLRPGQPLVME